MTKIIGLRTDPLPIDQPKESARFVLNGSLDSSDGDVMNYQNELGTDLTHQLPDGYRLIGARPLPDNDVVLFSTNGITSEIGLFNSGTYAALVNTPCLNFSTYVRSVYRILNGCDRIIYWNDGVNPDRQLNIDSLADYQDNSGNWDCNLFKLNPDYLIPEVTINTVNDSGGSIEPGGYSFAVELLDESLNSIAVGFPTNFIPVYNDRVTSSYDAIHGSLGASVNEVEGGIELTTKSISLTLSNLDTRYDYARVIVIAKNSGRGLAEEAYELTDYLPITKASIDYVFTSLTNAARTDVDSVRVKSVKYTTSKALAIVDGRLSRANLVQDTRDYSDYQRTVNNITVTWGRVQRSPFDITIENNTRNPLSYNQGNTWMADEIEALAIEFIYSDGSVSPAFHIPGRASVTSDLISLTVIDGPAGGNNINISDVSHLGLSAGETIPRWQYENTATGVLSGQLGYHESIQTYPTTVDCNGEYIYGNLAGTPIRHHRIPSRYNFPTNFIGSSGEVQVNKFYLTFSGVTYPDTDIVGHRFLRAKKQESEKTVVDGAILHGFISEPFRDSPDVNDNYVFMYSLIDYGQDISTSIGSLVSPKILSDKFNGAEYIEILGFHSATRVSGSTISRNGISAGTSIRTLNSNISGMTSRYRSLVKSRMVSPNSILNGEFDRPVINRSFSNTKLICELSSALSDTVIDGVIRVVLKKLADPHTNLYQIQYEPVTRILSLTDTQRAYGPAFVNHMDFFELHSVGVERTGFFNTNTELELYADFLRDIFVDSDINYELRVEGTQDNIHYDDSQELGLYTISQVADFDGSAWKIQAGPAQQYYRINDDYSFANGGTSRLPVPFNYDYCSNCLDKFPNTIVWSPKSFSEERSDSFRINLVNDYVVVGENTGEITTLHYDKNRMLVLTRNSCHLMAPNPQVINTDVDTAYIGTGDFLGIPPAEFAKTDYGFGGCQGRLASVNTEYGFFWCDQQAGRIFQFNGSIEELSSKKYGNSAYFRSNLPSVYKEDVQMSYDPYYKRVLIHKSDYRLIGTDDQGFSNHDNYENLSFTMSFSPELGVWVSFHSWQPDFMFSDRRYLYTSNANIIWSHTRFSSEFYGYNFPFIIEYVEASPLTTYLELVTYYAQTLDQNGSDLRYPTFDMIWCYSADQSTGEQTLIPKTDYPKFWSNVQKTVVHAEQNYRVSQLRDIAVGSPVTSTAWSDRKSKYFGTQGYIDKVPVNIDLDANQWSLVPLNNKYHQVRLIYSGAKRIILNLTETVTKPSVL